MVTNSSLVIRTLGSPCHTSVILELYVNRFFTRAPGCSCFRWVWIKKISHSAEHVDLEPSRHLHRERIPRGMSLRLAGQDVLPLARPPHSVIASHADLSQSLTHLISQIPEGSNLSVPSESLLATVTHRARVLGSNGD